MDLITRNEWGALSPRGPIGNMGPARSVFGHHTVTLLRDDARPRDVAEHMRYLQRIAFGRRFYDISYNYAISESGLVAEGRGFGKVGAHTAGYNSTAHAFVFIGNFDNEKITDAALEAFAELYEMGVSKDHINKGAPIWPHQKVSATACPGRNVLANMSKLRSLAKAEVRDPGADDRAAGADGIWQKGESGGRIVTFKSMLRDHGYGPSEWSSPSEMYGAQMESVVEAFQNDHGLVVDGIIGPDTIEAMKEQPPRSARWKEIGVRGDLIFPNAPTLENEWINPGLELLQRRIKKYGEPGEEYTFRVRDVKEG